MMGTLHRFVRKDQQQCAGSETKFNGKRFMFSNVHSFHNNVTYCCLYVHSIVELSTELSGNIIMIQVLLLYINNHYTSDLAL